MNIPDYTLIRKCGEGAYGEVWLAEGLGGKKVAVKIIPDKELAEKEFDGIRKSETLPVSKYRVQILHVGRTGGCLYYVMERADNAGSESEYEPATLAARIQIGRMHAEDVIELGLKLLQGIDEFHSANLYHRDIKPENIIYVDGNPKLSDIGLVCSGKDHRRSAGTLGFIPPEKVGNDSSVSSGSDDLYALGKVLYCCWTGSKPEKFPVVQNEYLNEENARILNQAIQRAAANKPEQRFSTAEEFKKALSFSSEDKVPKPSVLKRIQTAIAFPDKSSRYDIFLSYSHADAEFYGKHYIEEIKNEIENELYDVSCRSMVFLDTDALKYGDEWHAKIMEKLNECRVFICLLSDNYLKSQYCARERLWWGQKELREGRILHDTFPIYYVRLGTDPFAPGQSKEVQDLFGFQTNMQPWHTGKEELKESFIRERLSDLKSALKQHIARKINTEKSICTIVPGLSTSFVGRLTELKELREICANGRYPVIQAPGGVGKTELAVAYAYGYAEDYPEGRFMIRMEHRKNWKEALCSLAEEENVVTDLHLPDDIQTKSDEEKHKKIIAALFQKAQEGKLLLFLDNVDDPSLFTEKALRKFSLDRPIPSNLHMIATTRQALFFGANSHAQEFPIGNLDDSAAFDLFCQISNNHFPFCKNPVTDNDPEYKALMQIIHLLDGHVWSLEILAGYMAAHYQEGMTFRRKLEQLRKQFCIQGASSYRHHAEDGAALLEPTLEELKKRSFGDAILELAILAAFFPPDRIPVAILSAYWNQHFKALTYPDGEPFDYVLSTLKKFHLLKGDANTLKMHRLTQSVLKEKTADRDLYLSKLAVALENDMSFKGTTRYWHTFFVTIPEIFGFFSEQYKNTVFPPGSWPYLFNYPKLRPYCPWKKLSIKDKSEILESYPEYSDRVDFSLLDTGDWSRLLSDQPQFKDKCTIFNLFSGSDWSRLLSWQPQFAEQCPWESVSFSPRDFASLISHQPQFIDRLPKNCCDAEIWFSILAKDPSMTDSCPWDRLRATPRDWARFLCFFPDFANDVSFLKYCPWDSFSGYDWNQIPAEHPELFSYCKFENFNSNDWAGLLRGHPEFEKKCPWDSLKFSTGDWVYLIDAQPRFIKYIPADCMNSKIWFCILKNGYEFSGECPWEQLEANAADWGDLLFRKPEYENKCPFERFTTGEDWDRLLNAAPAMVKYFSGKTFTGDDWVDFLYSQPQFLSRCPWDSISISAGKWAELISRIPAAIDFFPKDCTAAAPWFEILKHNPSYDSLCPWPDIQATAKQWGGLLKERPDLAEKCPWNTFTVQDWASFLSVCPSFDKKCMCYEHFSGNDWYELLSRQNNPFFEQKCNWSLLTGENWLSLLRLVPEYGKYCSWEKLDEGAWKSLLRWQPQFSVYRKDFDLFRE